MERNPKIICKCGVAFAYLVTRKGNYIPINWDTIDPDERKSLAMGIPVPYEKFTNDAPPREKHKTHFIDCPYSRSFRKK